LNRVILIGNLTRDPELRYTPDGTPVASFTIAIDRPFTSHQGEKQTDFIPIVVWRKTAENCSEYLSKGSQVAVDGRLQIRSYEDKDGIKRKVSEVIAWKVKFLQRFKKRAPAENVEEDIENEIDKVHLDEKKQESGESEDAIPFGE